MAIAFDQASHGNGTGTSVSKSVTVAGSNTALFVVIQTGTPDTGSDVTGVTYNGVSMTNLGQRTISANEQVYLWGMVGAATGTNTLAVSRTNSGFVGLAWSSYTGVAQSGLPDSTANNSASSSTTLSISNTVVAADCWLVTGVAAAGGAASSFAGALRATDNFPAIGDSNGTVGTGSQSNLYTNSTSVSIWGVQVSIAPFTAPSLHSLGLMGVGT